MPFQTITSLIDTSNLFPTLMNFSPCRHRKRATILHVQEHAACHRSSSRLASELSDDADDTSKSTEAGDLSHNDFSDSSDQNAGSTDGSDTETLPTVCQWGAKYLNPDPTFQDHSDCRPFAGWTNVPMRPPPGLELDAPVGLDMPFGFGNLHCGQSLDTSKMTNDNEFKSHVPNHQGTRLKSDAKRFVPSFVKPALEVGPVRSNSEKLRHSIRLVKQSLEAWEAINFSTQSLHDPVEDCSLLALQEALCRLSPADAAVVRTLLDSTAGQREPDMPETWANALGHASGQSATQDPPRPPGQFYAHQSFADPTSGWTGSNPAAVLSNPCPAPKVSQKLFPLAKARQDNQHQQAASPTDRQHVSLAERSRGQEAADDAVGSLSAHLYELSLMDAARVVMVRKVNRLGFDAAVELEHHFSNFGGVERVMVSHSRSRSAPGKKARLRLATVGFVVMHTSDAAAAALALGPEHVVQGQMIYVSPFQSHSIDADE